MRIIFFIFIAITLSAQVQSQTFSGGLRGGMNLAQWKQNILLNSNQTGTISVALTTDSRTGYLIGVYYTIMFSKGVGLQPELFYNSVGARLGSSIISVDYVSLPIFLRYKLRTGERLFSADSLATAKKIFRVAFRASRQRLADVLDFSARKMSADDLVDETPHAANKSVYAMAGFSVNL